MIFNTWTFAVFAIITIGLYWLAVPRRLQPYALIVAGLVFYTWSVPAYTVLILCVAAITYAAGKAMLRNATPPAMRKAIFVAALVAIVGVLAFFKYGTLFATTFGLRSFPELLVPLAISFFTFEFVHFLTDVYLGRIASISVRDFALFALFFPTMVAGPIKRYEQFVPQIDRTRIDALGFWSAIYRIATALLKKTLADSTTPLVAPLLSPVATANGGDYAIAILAYSVKIYLDFTAYSDIAIAVANLLGYQIPENFLRPYGSASISEFWRRWHISLSSWIRDYLFIPLGGSRGRPIRTLLNLTLVMAIAGLWHGAAWHFVVWGLWHGSGLAVHRLWSQVTLARPRFSLNRSPFRRFSAVALTFAFVAMGWLLFACPSIDMAAHVYRGLLQY